MYDEKTKNAQEAVSYLQANETEIWSKLGQTESIADPALEKWLTRLYGEMFPLISPSQLNILHGDVESVARAQTLLRRENEFSQLVTDATKIIKSQYPKLWEALILRDASREDQLSSEYNSLFIECISDLRSSFKLSEVIWNIRIIIHAISLSILDQEKL